MEILDYEVQFLEKSKVAAGLPYSIGAPKVPKVINKLANAQRGMGHDCFLKGISVFVTMKYNAIFIQQFMRYKHNSIVSSQSKMHKLKDFALNAKMFDDATDPRAITLIQSLQDTYNSNPTQETYRTLVMTLPHGIELIESFVTNYLQLKTMYAQRRNHKLKDWTVFCDWIETLPNSEYITGIKQTER